MARIMDFVHDDSGSHVAKAAKALAGPDEDEDDDLLGDVKEGPEEEPYEGEDAEPEPDEPDEDAEDDADEEPDEKPEPKAAKRRDHLKAEMDRLVAESHRAQALEARLLDQERRAQLADLNSIKAHAALRSHQFEGLRRELDEAIELGEVARQSELRDRYHDARTELQQLGAYIQRQEYTLQQPVQQPQAPTPPPNPKAVAWTKKQKWWGKDDVLTGAAFIIDEKLIKEGVNPYTDQFYSELNKRLSPYMAQANRRRQAVAGVDTRSVPQRSGRKVKLDAEQREMARRLNVPPEEYAKFVDY
jgi:hypothetical protein